MLHVVALASGKRVRSLPLSSYIAGSATVAGRQAFVGHYGNAVVCADIVSGKTVWTYRERGFPYFSTPAVAPDRMSWEGGISRCTVLTGRPVKVCGHSVPVVRWTARR
jgi:outer membrane protein assembly factor BamB